MIKDHEAVVKADMAVRQVQIIDGAARKLGLGEVFQIITPVAEHAAQRKGKINLIEQLKARRERIQNVPGVSELGLGSGIPRPGPANLAARSAGAEGEERSCGNEGIARGGGIQRTAAEQDQAGLAAQQPDQRFGRVRGRGGLDQWAHAVTRTPWA